MVWFETGPGAIADDPVLATTIVKIGLASNAINAVLLGSKILSRRRRNAAKTRDSLQLLVMTSAFLKEAIELAQREMARLRPLAQRAGMKGQLLDQVGQLCAGKHGSSDILRYARKKIGFHWDDDLVHASVLEFQKNRKLVWLESDRGSHPVHTLAFNVLAHALFPKAAAVGMDVKASKAAVSDGIQEVGEALELITEFFTASMYGYLHQVGAVKRPLRGKVGRD